jgi:hypothetical protein
MSIGMLTGFVALAIGLVGYVAVQGWSLKLGPGGIAAQVIDLGLGDGDSSTADDNATAHPGPVAHAIDSSLGEPIAPTIGARPAGGRASDGVGRHGGGHRGGKGSRSDGSQAAGGNLSPQGGGQTQSPGLTIPQQPAAPAPAPETSHPPASPPKGGSDASTGGYSKSSPGQAKKPAGGTNAGGNKPKGTAPGQANKQQAVAVPASGGSGKTPPGHAKKDH